MAEDLIIMEMAKNTRIIIYIKSFIKDIIKSCTTKT